KTKSVRPPPGAACAANSTRSDEGAGCDRVSPPPCGEGSGVGVTQEGDVRVLPFAVGTRLITPPLAPPRQGEGNRVRGAVHSRNAPIEFVGTLAFAITIAVVVLGTGPALAHTGHEHAVSFAAGFAHPWSGLDHMPAMVAV